MAADLVLAPEAEWDIAEAYAWYEARGVGLGERFLTVLDARIALIHRQPLLFARVHEEYRRPPAPALSLRCVLRLLRA